MIVKEQASSAKLASLIKYGYLQLGGHLGATKDQFKFIAFRALHTFILI